MLVVYDLEVSGHYGTENCMETWYNSKIFLNFADFFGVIFQLQNVLIRPHATHVTLLM